MGEFLIIPILCVPLGYVLGSIPTAVWVTRWLRGVDVRDAGSGHATTTNTIRQAGWAAGVFVLAVDIAKGFIPVYLALQSHLELWLVALTASAAVLGHCWPVWAGFRGGMGLATAGGAILAASPLGFLLGLGLLVALVLIIHHSARASVVTGIMLPFLYWYTGFEPLVVWVAGGVGLVIAVRFTSDWSRKYRELWLDRPPR